jgi:hypothetical protein
MGSGAYREHFFGSEPATRLLGKAIGDQMRYSVPALKLKRKTQARLSWQKKDQSNV